VITVTEPQVWTIIGVLSASIVGMVTFGFTMLLRVIRAEIGGLRNELRGELQSEVGGLRAELQSEVGGLRTELQSELGALRAEMRAGFERIDTRLDTMDRDINALMKHTFGIDRE